MRIVRFKAKKIDDYDYRGEVKVAGYVAIDYDTSPEEVKTKLIAHLLEEGEIKQGNYQVEEAVSIE